MSVEAKHYDVIRAPLVSEKASRLQTQNQVVFKVAREATKTEVKAAVEALFKVSVRAVSVVNVKGKAKAFKGRLGQRGGFRKAYVTLAEGQAIDFGQKVL